MKNILIHIPHSSYIIPNKYKDLFYLKGVELFQEQLKMSDSFTDELFNIKGIQRHIFPISRLVCDVERFRNEEDEEMTKQGMWICYTKTSDCKALKKVDTNHKKEILNLYYDKHHSDFEEKIERMLKKHKKCLIIDAHSFSSKPLPYELHAQTFRPDICIGTDFGKNVLYNEKLVNLFETTFLKYGYKNVTIDDPFSATYPYTVSSYVSRTAHIPCIQDRYP